MFSRKYYVQSHVYNYNYVQYHVYPLKEYGFLWV